MRSLISVLVAFGVCSGVLAHGQGPSIGMKAGGHLNQPFFWDFSETPTEPNRLVLGPSVEFPLSSALAVEASALLSRGEASGPRFRGGRGPIIVRFPYRRTVETLTASGRSWEFPVVLKAYYSITERLKLFGLVGLAVRHFHVDNHHEFTVFETEYRGAEAKESHYTTRSSIGDWRAGLTVGGGFEVPLGPLRLQPQVRATNWFNPPTYADVRLSPLTLDAMLGIVFGS